jgi:exopolyphosphatase/guanosine-5'-triphosphate,3'-diphosphate pyrophosphatase
LFCKLSLGERRKIEGLSEDRGDIILAGALTVLGVFERLDIDGLTISTAGLREGVFFEYFWEHLPNPVIPDVRRFSVLNMARIYRYHERHANHVRFLAGRLFEQLQPLHDYGADERELLDAAALLHDIGTVIAYDGHHRHSQTLIEYNGLAGFSRRETALIALLTRYHRKGTPQITGYESLLRKKDEVLLLRLAAILRLAEFLERGRNAAVDDIIVTWGEDFLRLTLIADDHPAVEIWEAERNALPLLEKAFARQPSIDTMAAPPSGD